jgi:hypothetical protein
MESKVTRYSQYHYSDEELLALAEDRAPDTNEIFVPNSWYGFAKAIKDYSKWPFPLPFVVPHGVVLNTRDSCDSEMASNLPSVYSYPWFRRQVFEKNSNFLVLEGCSPWLYLLKKNRNTFSHKKGTVVFPSHSTLGIECNFLGEEKLISEILNFPEEMKPVTICLYWRDVQLGRHLSYIDKGLPVITAGHMNDQSFLERLLKIFSDHEYLYTTEMGSHIFFGATTGMKVILNENFGVEYLAPKAIIDKDLWFPDELIGKNVRQIFNKSPCFRGQKDYALDFLGEKNMYNSRLNF